MRPSGAFGERGKWICKQSSVWRQGIGIQHFGFRPLHDTRSRGSSRAWEGVRFNMDLQRMLCGGITMDGVLEMEAGGIMCGRGLQARKENTMGQQQKSRVWRQGRRSSTEQKRHGENGRSSVHRRRGEIDIHHQEIAGLRQRPVLADTKHRRHKPHGEPFRRNRPPKTSPLVKKPPTTYLDIISQGTGSRPTRNLSTTSSTDFFQKKTFSFLITTRRTTESSTPHSHDIKQRLHL